ncbi:periplasmic heavy metal sensor [Nannocystaceae bacterium ST9]
MLGIIIGTAAVLGTAAYCRRRAHRYGYGRRWGHHGHGHGYGQGFHGYGHHGCHGGWQGGHDESEHDHEGFFGGQGRGPWGQGPWARGGFGGGMVDRWASMLAWRLEASPSQSEVIHAAFRSVADELHAVADERKATRDDLGKAVSGEHFDEQVMGELFARHDQRLEQIRRSVVGALAKIHEVLEPVQRERLAGLLGKRGFGPYRM